MTKTGFEKGHTLNIKIPFLSFVTALNKHNPTQPLSESYWDSPYALIFREGKIK